MRLGLEIKDRVFAVIVKWIMSIHGGDNAEEKGKSSVRIKEAGDRDYFNSNIISWISLVASTYFIEQNALRTQEGSVFLSLWG